MFCLETGDVEEAVARAVEAGATLDGEVADGEGACRKVKDPYGNVWAICTTPAPAPGADAA